MSRISDAKIVTFGLELLRGGIPTSNLPRELIEEFFITEAQAQALTGRAIERWKKEKASRK
jgi:hypothetical protein